MVMRSLPEGPVSVDEILPGFGFLRELWDREFRFDPDRSDADLIHAGLAALEDYGAIARRGEAFEVVSVDQIGELYQLFRNFAEAYLLVLRRADQLKGQTKKSFPKLLLKDADALISVGVVTRPEALSTITLGNAVSTYLRRGVFTQEGDELGFHEDLVNADLRQLSPMVD